MSERDKNEVEIEFLDGQEDKPGKKRGARKVPVENPAAAAGTPPAEEAKPAPLISQEELDIRDARIAGLQKELAQFKDAYVRKAADMENLRKRLEREKADHFQYALTDLLSELLTVLDNLERALETPGDEANGKSFREGVELIYRLFSALLAKNGVKELDTTDKKFDPNVHHATSTEEAEGIEEPEIAEVLQKGYYLNNRLLRPAMVRVYIPKKD